METRARLRRLRHEWLENTLFAWRADDLVFAWHESGWPALERECDEQMHAMKQLLPEVELAFSPALLVDQLAPLQGLSCDGKSELKAKLHEAFIARSGISDLRSAIRVALHDLKHALAAFFAIWRMQPSKDAEPALSEAWGEVQHKARALRDFIDRLPKGPVWL